MRRRSLIAVFPVAALLLGACASPSGPPAADAAAASRAERWVATWAAPAVARGDAPAQTLSAAALAYPWARDVPAAVAELGLPKFRGKQLANQYYGRLIADPHEMTDLPASVAGRWRSGPASRRRRRHSSG